MHMTPELAEQNAIDQLRADAQKLTDEAGVRQAALDEQIASAEQQPAEEAPAEEAPAEEPAAEAPTETAV